MVSPLEAPNQTGLGDRLSTGMMWGDMVAQIPDLVSVVIPVRDRVPALARALESVERQTSPASEVIVVDDGSAVDPRDALAARFPSVCFVRQAPRGVSAARNRGIKEATGTWLAFLDSDDEWMPQKLEHQLHALRENAGHRICHTDEIWIRKQRRVNPRRRHAKAGGMIFQRCLPLCVISPSAALLERSLVDEVGGFDESLPVCEDYDLWLRICSRYPVLYVDAPLTLKHGGHADQLSRRYWGMDRFRIRAIRKIVESGVLRTDDRRAAIRTLAEKIDVYVEGARKRGKQAEVLEYESIRDRYIANKKERSECQRSTGS